MTWVASTNPLGSIPVTLHLWILHISSCPSLPSATLVREQDLRDEPTTWKAASSVFRPPADAQTCSLTWEARCVETLLFQLGHGFLKQDGSELRKLSLPHPPFSPSTHSQTHRHVHTLMDIHTHTHTHRQHTCAVHICTH